MAIHDSILPPSLDIKVCRLCGESKPLEEYTRRDKYSDKRDSRCKECVRAYQRADPNKLKRNIAWDKTQRAKDTDWIKSRRRKNVERLVKRRTQMRETSTVAILPKYVFERDNFTCQLCHGPLLMNEGFPHPLSPSVDHVIPMSKGGAHVYENVQASHLRCNISKSDRIAA